MESLIKEMKFHHIGVAVKDIGKSIKIYHDMGFVASEVIYDDIQKVNICFLTKQDHPTIELVEPADEKAPVNSILQKVGVSAYHCCYETDKFEKTIEYMRRLKFIILKAPVIAKAMENKKICFLYSINYGLIELVSKK
ncbi:MAG: VOC family protein [bacterium]|nr:VOC family protein [bacterium]